MLLTVISVCMTTLGILAFATARADWNMAQKYADTIQTRYALEAEGQRFLQTAARALREGPLRRRVQVIVIMHPQGRESGIRSALSVSLRKHLPVPVLLQQLPHLLQAAFYIEALLLAAVFTVVILTLTRVFAWSGQRGRDAALLPNSTLPASVTTA